MPERTTRAARRPREANPAKKLMLRILGTSKAIKIDDERCLVGNGGGVDVSIDDPYVSKRHCELYRTPEKELRVRDLASRNGVWVNEVRINDVGLGARARLVVGRTGLQLVADDEGRPCGMVGEHPTMLKVYEQIRRIGPTLHPVVILGETGTGKELVARALHEASACHLGPFEAVNCSAIPQQLAESELFGHARGAFTGADRAHEGAFVRADGGTLFLDEIGEMPLELQPKLLRALEEGVVQPVGASQPRNVSIRVIAATHRALSADAHAGRFRLDLFHRLAVGVIALPALRERPSDIGLLLTHFLRLLAQDGVPFELDDDVVAYLESHAWAGNVRALYNAARRATALGGPIIHKEDFQWLEQSAPANEMAAHVLIHGRHFEEIRREIYNRTLKRTGGNRSAAAATLGIAKSTFFDQLRAMGIGTQMDCDLA